jgi:hypothetical protein
MTRSIEDNTAKAVSFAYDAIVERGADGPLGELAGRLRTDFKKRTGTFNPEDPWFETRARAFWDDALTGQGFAVEADHAMGKSFSRAHRGLFVVDERDDRGALLVDLWSGAELVVRYLDETQALTLEHADAAFDARIVAAGDALYVLPGAYHHPPDALDATLGVLEAARGRGLSTDATLDALLRMELVLRASSRVKPSFAYRVEALPRAR